MICPICHHKIKLLLSPDYSSSGIWCSTCGTNFARPKESLEKLPNELIDAIDGWNFYWDLYHTHYKEFTSESYMYFKKGFVELGKMLNIEVNKYYDCVIYTDDDTLFADEKCVDCDPIDNPKCDRCLGV
jgi:hypothetical protein